MRQDPQSQHNPDMFNVRMLNASLRNQEHDEKEESKRQIIEVFPPIQKLSTNISREHTKNTGYFDDIHIGSKRQTNLDEEDCSVEEEIANAVKPYLNVGKKDF
eukprot:CAMPEP_0168331900 /NCGR_PEP_ID=MMETSP0213-20121227/8618_1 /TAXON_ID=151035 /ORGANISM="Euplotes harpa, Strain FSP1.4" /LENGTH=102 /DNA_ID=CAMNT_0008335783 /DNA_START=528 /DNA_END=833 /DNA_ORIENTATION=-